MTSTALNVWELVAKRFEPPTQNFPSPGALAAHLNPKIRQTPALDLIDQKLLHAFNTPDSRLIISMPPQEGKSERAVRAFALWMLTKDPEMRVVIASYSKRLAGKWGRVIRDDIKNNGDKLGNLRVRQDVSAQHNWQLDGGYEGGVYTTSVGGEMTGEKAGAVIIDDPHKNREEANSKTKREAVHDWWDSTVQARLAPGAPVIVIQTRWHQQDLAGWLASEYPGEWETLNIPAQANHRPEKGEEDPLGREPGEFMVSARGRTQAQWEKRKANTSMNGWAALYQGRPSPEQGGVFPATDTWARYMDPLWTTRGDGVFRIAGVGERRDHELIQSWDFTFKDKASSDYVVGQVWFRMGQTAYLVDQVRERMSFSASQAAMLAMHKKWPQAYAILVEDKANGPAIITSLRKRIPGIIAVEPQGSKYARAEAISPYVFGQNVVLPSSPDGDAPNRLPTPLLDGTASLLEEAIDFPNSAHDDTIDAMSQAVKALLQDNMEEIPEDVVEPEEYDAPPISYW